MARGYILPPTVIERGVKPVVFVLALLPFFWLVWQLWFGLQGLPHDLGANPISESNFFLGRWALRFLLLALAITPLRIMTGRVEFARFRRMIGLFAFFYAAMHLISYVVLDQFFDWTAIWKDIVKRTYITLGMAAVVIMIPLAITSTHKMIRRLGAKRWQRLHRAVYVAAVLGVTHFYLLVKADVTEPLIYAAILAFLLGFRVVRARPWRKFSRQRSTRVMT